MRNEWSSLINLGHDSGSPHIFPTESQLSQGFGLNVLQQFGTLVDNSFHGSKQICVSGNLALQEAFNRLNKFVGALFVQLSSGSNSNLLCRLSSNSHESHPFGYQSQIKNVTSYLQILSGLHFGSGSKDEHYIPVILAKLASSTLGRFWREIEKNHSFHILSLAGVLVPPFEYLSAKVLAESVTLVNNDEQINGVVDHSLRENNNRGCLSRTISNITRKENAIEPKTGIKFPTALEDNSNLSMEVLVGTGFRSMKIIKLKSLKVYAFGLYIHPESVCEKLGRKYSSVPISELMNCSEFFKDLLREDISMTVRLVVNCNGLKINSVRSAFEKSLRTRLQKVFIIIQSKATSILLFIPNKVKLFLLLLCPPSDKMNPETDFHCLTTFGSYFTRDIPIPMGTTIDFRQTADGQLITKIGAEHIGAVRSKDLCKAFFDMYIGDLPVSLPAKEEIAQNVADLIRKC